MSIPPKFCERPVHSGPMRCEFFGDLNSRETAIGEREDLGPERSSFALPDDGFGSQHHSAWRRPFVVLPLLIGSLRDEQLLRHLTAREAELFPNRNQSGAIIIPRHGPCPCAVESALARSRAATSLISAPVRLRGSWPASSSLWLDVWAPDGDRR